VGLRKLRAGIGHEPEMPLLTELGNDIWEWGYNYIAPDGAAGKTPVPSILNFRRRALFAGAF
jgi:hypothetical protein